jgi:hypothetical protein
MNPTKYPDPDWTGEVLLAEMEDMAEEVFSRHKVCRRLIIGGVWTEERADSRVPGKEYIVADELRPVLLKVGKWDDKINFGRPEVEFDVELEAPLR